jgi:hypothetical protein
VQCSALAAWAAIGVWNELVRVDVAEHAAQGLSGLSGVSTVAVDVRHRKHGLSATDEFTELDGTSERMRFRNDLGLRLLVLALIGTECLHRPASINSAIADPRAGSAHAGGVCPRLRCRLRPPNRS